MRTSHVAASVGLLLACVAWAPRAGAAIYPDQTLVNLLRQYDLATGTLLTQISAYYPIMDGGYWGTQVGPYNPATPGTMNFDISLAAVQNASKLILDYTDYHPGSFSIYYSATGFDNLTPLVLNVPDTNTNHYEYLFPGGDDGTPVRYLRFLQTTGVDQYIRIGEFQLKGAANNTLDDQADGYNLLANRTRISPITSWSIPSGDNPNVGVDNDIMSGWVRPGGGNPAWFVIPLTDSISIAGINLGFYDSWGNCYIDVSDDLAMPDPTASLGWKPVYAKTTSQGTQFL
jgi:hypothetical protein